MDEHQEPIDEADVTRRLHRAGTDNPGVDTTALTAGARRRAHTIRRHRQKVAGGVIAVLAAGVPVGLTQWPSAPETVTPATSTTTATPSPTALTAIPDAVLPTTEEVTAVVPGLKRLDPPQTTSTGFCTDIGYNGETTVVDSRTLGWGDAADAASSPFVESAEMRVLLFNGTAAVDWMAQVKADAESCALQVEGTASWQLSDDAGVSADQAIAGTAQHQQSGTNSLWRATVVARRGQLVVRATVETLQPTSSESLTQAVDLVNAELAKASGLQDAGGAAR